MKLYDKSMMGAAILMAVASGNSLYEGQASVTETAPSPKREPRQWPAPGTGARECARRRKQRAKQEAGR